MASYSVEFKTSAVKELASIDRRADRERVAERIWELADDPRPHDCKKLVGRKNTYRIRQGDYRIIYDIEDDRLLVLVIEIAHRKDAYRRR